MPARNPIASAVAMCAALVLVGLGLVIAIAQEKPIGSLVGTVIAQDTGNRISARVNIISSDKKYRRFAESGKDGAFRFIDIPAGQYTIECSSRAHLLKPVQITVEEGKTKTIDLEVPPSGPFLDLDVEEHIFTPGERPRVTSRGWNNADTVDVQIYGIDINSFILKSEESIGDLSEFSVQANDAQRKAMLDSHPYLRLAKSFSVPIKGRDAEGVFIQRIFLPTLPQGMYIVSTKVGNLIRSDWIMITSLGMITKTVGNRTLAYTMDLKTGKPMPGSEVSVYIDRKLVASGTTDARGLLDLRLPPDIKGATNQTILARNGNSSALAGADYSGVEESKRTIYAYTERPVYKPGQRVYFKGVVREALLSGYKSVAHLPMLVEARDARDTLVYRGMMKTDKFGSYSGSFVLDKETSSGSYTLVSTPEGSGEGSSIDFQVAAYRKPEFEVKVNLPKKHYVMGDEVRASVSADYYFGAPLANATVTYAIHRQPYWPFGDEEEESEGYQDYGGYGEEVSSGTAQTDGRGRAEISFVPKQDDSSEGADSRSDQLYTIDASITDKSGNETTGTASTLVTQGDFSMEISNDRYIVAPGDKVGISVNAVDYDKHVVAGQKIKIVTGMETYTETGESKFRETGEYETVTDKFGRASLQFPAKESGNMKIIATSEDSHGRTVSAYSYVWCYSDAFQDTSIAVSDLEVVTDKKIYKPGETAKVLINTKQIGVTALVTVEGDRIFDSRIVKINSPSTMISIPIKNEYKPNFYIGVCFVKNKKLANQQQRVRVSIDQSALRVEIHPNKAKYLPGERATYNLRATDSNGRPAKAQLSIGVVDEAIYAIEKDTTKNILDFFYARKPNNVHTNFSFPEIYLSDPDKAGPSLLKTTRNNARIRKRFEDTAYWNSTVETDAKGRASVSFQMPDNLTTWRATVRGITEEGSSFGEATNTVLAQQDFIVRLEAPRFLVQSDEAVISAIVHNYTGKGMQTRVSLDAPGLRISDGPDKDIFISNDTDERLTWLVKAVSVGSKPITVRAKCGDTADAMQIELPIYALGAERTSEEVGTISSTGVGKVPLDLRADSISGTARLRVRLTPSLAGSMLGAVRYLAEYPYGCTEQTVSSFLPDVILSRSLSELGIHDPKTEAELPEMVKSGLFRLYRFQLPDGGWSWCEYGKSDEWMTAYVCYALIRAREAGFAVNDAILTNGLQNLSDRIANETTDAKSDVNEFLNTRTYSLYVLSMAGRDVSGNLAELTQRSNLPGESLALIALSYQNLHRIDRAQAVLDRLLNLSISDSATIYWNGIDSYGSSTETTACALEALLRIRPLDARAYKIVRKLMQYRQMDCWYSTRQTATVLYAMSIFLKSFKELDPNYDVTILLNGKVEAKKHFGKSSIFQPEEQIEIPAQDLRNGKNYIEVRKSGQGNLYYSTKFTQFVSSGIDREIVSDSGVSIAREFHHSSEQTRPWDYREAGPLVSDGNVGDTILVRLTVTSKTRLSHLLVEDFIPAGCEVQDQGSLDYWDWSDWWVGEDVRDEKVSFYIDDLSPGKHVIEYRMRAGFAGKFHALPAQVFAMYQPSMRAATAATEFTIR
jgi:hypothetical protein